MENLFLSKVRVSVSGHWEYYHKSMQYDCVPVYCPMQIAVRRFCVHVI